MASNKSYLGTVLIVDDEEEVRDFISIELECQGYSVLHAEDGKKALHVLESHQVDAIVSDIRMLKMSGVEFFNRVNDN